MTTNELRPYQRDVLVAVEDSCFNRKGLTFSVEIARQGGKNELSAHLELELLVLNRGEHKDLIKCSPTFQPQALISMRRLEDCLDAAGCGGNWWTERGYIVGFGYARAVFLSADESSRVVGHTANLLLEVDEAQDVDADKFTKDFKPMGATGNVTTVLYGTTWDDATLLEQIKQANLELERKDGVRRHFRYDWQEVAKYNPDYLAYVEGERHRLGEDHPLFRTQYLLLPIRGGGGFLSTGQRAQLQGEHPRLHAPERDSIYVAGVDLAGEAEELGGWQAKNVHPRQDATVVTIAEIDTGERRVHRIATGSAGARGSVPLREDMDDRLGVSPFDKEPVPCSTREGSRGIWTEEGRGQIPLHLPLQKGDIPTIRIVEHYAWTGRRHADLYPQLVDLLKNVWHCRRVVVDATGVGQPVYSFLREALGSAVVPFVFTAPSKSELGFNVLAAVNSGRLKVYAVDGSKECREFWSQMEKAKSYYRASQTMNFYVDPSQGHDDFLMSLALVVEAGARDEPRVARGK